MGALMEKRRYSESSAREAARDSSRGLHFTARVDEKRGLTDSSAKRSRF